MDLATIHKTVTDQHEAVKKMDSERKAEIEAAAKAAVEASAAVKAEAESRAKAIVEINGKIDDILKKGEATDKELKDLVKQAAALLNPNRGTGAEPVLTPGSAFVKKSDQFDKLLSREYSAIRIECETPAAIVQKAAGDPITSGASPLYTLPTDRQPGIVAARDQVTFVADYLNVIPTTSVNLEWVRESAFNNQANTVAENVGKPASNVEFELVTASIPTIAHYMKASKQILSDAPALRAHIDKRLLLGLRKKLDSIIVTDLLAAASTYAGAAGEKMLDKVRNAIAAIEAAEAYSVNLIVMNPADWAKCELVKDSTGQYILGGTKQLPQGVAPKQLWGRPVVTSPSISAGTALVGDFQQAGDLWVREQMNVQVGFENADFTKNMVTILAEMRAKLAILLPGALRDLAMADNAP